MDESLELRPPPARPYAWSGAVLVVSVTAIEATLALLRRFGPREACAFWFGDRNDEAGEVHAVVSPRQRMEPRWYDVPADCMSEMAGWVSGGDWRPVAQVHSHPGPWVEHSLYDDRMVASRRALSLVIPNYGRWRGPWPRGLGVHECVDDYWHLLSEPDASRRVRLEPAREMFIRDLRA